MVGNIKLCILYLICGLGLHCFFLQPFFFYFPICLICGLFFFLFSFSIYIFQHSQVTTVEKKKRTKQKKKAKNLGIPFYFILLFLFFYFGWNISLVNSWKNYLIHFFFSEVSTFKLYMYVYVWLDNECRRGKEWMWNRNS